MLPNRIWLCLQVTKTYFCWLKYLNLNPPTYSQAWIPKCFSMSYMYAPAGSVLPGVLVPMLPPQPTNFWYFFYSWVFGACHALSINMRLAVREMCSEFLPTRCQIRCILLWFPAIKWNSRDKWAVEISQLLHWFLISEPYVFFLASPKMRWSFLCSTNLLKEVVVHLCFNPCAGCALAPRGSLVRHDLLVYHRRSSNFWMSFDWMFYRLWHFMLLSWHVFRVGWVVGWFFGLGKPNGVKTTQPMPTPLIEIRPY